MSSGVATGSVATSSVATRFVALSDVATSGVVGGRVTEGAVAAALVAAGGVAFEGVVVHGVAWVCSDGACRAGPRGLRCWPGFAEPLAGGPLVTLNNPPGVVRLGARVRGAPEVGLESTAVRVPSTMLGVPVSDVDLVPGDTSKADAPFDSGGEAIVAAGDTYAWRRDATALAVAIQAKK